MKKSAFEVIEETSASKENILIVDRRGIIGSALSKKLSDDCLTFLLSEKQLENTENLFFIPFRKRIPSVPNNLYSQIFVVFDKDLEETGQLWEFLKKAKQDRAKFFFLISIFEDNNSLIKKILDLNPESRLLFLGDLFPIAKSRSPINLLLSQAKEFGKVEVSETGLERLYPVCLEEAIGGILEILFGTSDSRVFFLFPKHPPTELSMTRMLKKADPELCLDFIKEKIKNQKEEFILNIPKEGDYLLNEAFLEQAVKQELSNLPKKTISQFPRLPKKEKPIPFISKAFVFYLFLSVLLFPLLAVLVPSFLGFWQLSEAKNSVERGNFESAKKEAKISHSLFALSGNFSGPLVFEASLVGKKDAVVFFLEGLNTGKELSEIIIYSSDAFLKFKKVAFGNSLGTREDFNDGLNSLKAALEIFQKVKVKNEEFKKFESVLRFVANTQDAYPTLLGFEGKKVYLVLFQNNMELRPGGGFIGSYGLITLNNGRVEDFSINDVYDADGQLKGHIEPPFAIRRYLPSVHWYLRDSNFDVDFSKNASTAAFFLKEETGKVIDGVIGADVTFVKKLLESIGPVWVADYNETVTFDNLYLLTQTHAEKNFFPGSSQKKDFLRSLFAAIKLNLSSGKNIFYPNLLKTVTEAISQKHLLLSSPDPWLHTLFEVNNMSSSTRDERKNDENNIDDFLGLSEANIGVNKANYFILRKVSRETVIDDKGNISAKLTIKYKNTGKSSDWPGGDYKNYLRIILPLDTNLLAIEIDGKPVSMTTAMTDPAVYEAKNFNPPKGLEVEKSVENGKTIYGFLMLVPTETLKTVVISYSLFQKVNPDAPVFNYDFLYFKQPGTEDYPFDFSLFYPSSYNLGSKTEGLTLKENKVSFSKDILSDQKISIGFTKR